MLPKPDYIANTLSGVIASQLSRNGSTRLSIGLLRLRRLLAEKDYTPNAVNCSFCIRLNLPCSLGPYGHTGHRHGQESLLNYLISICSKSLPLNWLFKEAFQRFCRLQISG